MVRPPAKRHRAASGEREAEQTQLRSGGSFDGGKPRTRSRRRRPQAQGKQLTFFGTELRDGIRHGRLAGSGAGTPGLLYGLFEQTLERFHAETIRVLQRLVSRLAG